MTLVTFRELGSAFGSENISEREEFKEDPCFEQVKLRAVEFSEIWGMPVVAIDTETGDHIVTVG